MEHHFRTSHVLSVASVSSKCGTNVVLGWLLGVLGRLGQKSNTALFSWNNTNGLASRQYVFTHWYRTLCIPCRWRNRRTRITLALLDLKMI